MSLFEAAPASNEPVRVSINGIGFVSFERGTRSAIRAENLNGGTLVMAVSKRGALVCHIPPLPYVTTDPHVGEEHVIQKMHIFGNFLETESELRSATYQKLTIVCGMYQGSIALPHQVDIIKDMLQENKTENQEGPCIIGYQVQEACNRSPGAGTVFIDGRGECPRVFIEDVDQEWVW